MRIIAGTHRGRRLLTPASDTTRPYTDRVKQSLFDVLMPLLDDAVVYDLFAGTGSIGLECLSRGARSATFFEADRSALALLRRNISDLQMSDRALVRPGDVFKMLGKAPATVSPDHRANLIFLDPPYRFLREKANDLCALASTITTHHLAPHGTLIFRHDADDALQLPDLTTYDHRDYGSMVIELLSPAAAQIPTPQG